MNSEEAYQNMVRFLFGDIRVDIWLDVTEVRLPKRLEPKAKDVEALYMFELLAAPRGKRWYLSRRVVEEDSPACRTHRQLTNPTEEYDRSVYLSSVFLSKRARVNQQRPSLAYSMTVGVRVPDYQVEKRFWPDQHYEGGNLYRDTAIIEVTAPEDRGGGDDWEVKLGWLNKSDGVATKKLKFTDLGVDGKVQVEIGFSEKDKHCPGITGKIRLVVRDWS